MRKNKQIRIQSYCGEKRKKDREREREYSI